MCPHRHTSRNMNQLKQAGQRTESLPRLAVLNLDFKQSIVVTLTISELLGNCGEFLVCWHKRRGNIVCQQNRVCEKMAQLNNIAVLNLVASEVVLGEWNTGQNLPLVVGVVVGVTGNLLSLTGDTPIIIAKRVLVIVTVKVDLGVLVADDDVVIVFKINSIGGQWVVGQRCLELGSHKVITRSRASQDREMHLEPEQVKEERDDKQRKTTGCKMLAEPEQGNSSTWSLDVKQVPQINKHSRTNSNKGEHANILGGNNTAQTDTGQEEPLPPFAAKFIVTLFVELDVAEDADRDTQDQASIQQDQAVFTDVSIVKDHQSGSQNTGRQGISRLPHDIKDDRNSQRSKSCGQSAVCEVGDFVRDVGIANVLKGEAAIVADQPAYEGKQQFGEWRMDIEEVGSLEIVRSELHKIRS